MRTTGYIYKITSPTGKMYIGKTVNITNRMSDYRCSNLPPNTLINRSILKYGVDAHTFEIIDEPLLDNLAQAEMFYINLFQSYRANNPRGMNLTLGGEGCLGRVCSEESKQKSREKMRGRKPSENTRNALIKKLKGKPISAEHKLAISEGIKKALSDDGVRKEMSERSKEMWARPEYREKMKEARMGHTVSDETKNKLREANSGKRPSDDAIEKMRNTLKRKYQSGEIVVHNKGKKANPESTVKMIQTKRERYIERMCDKMQDYIILHRHTQRVLNEQ